MSRIDRIYEETPEPRGFASAYLGYLTEILAAMDADAIGRFTEALLDARERESHIYFLGNGGSAATASHFVNDLRFGTRSAHKPFRAVCLSDNTAVMTALANDYGYDEVFVHQLLPVLATGDVVVAISVSGNSPNVVKAVDIANQRGAVTVGLTGFDGGRLAETAHINVHVPTEPGEYGPAEDVHMVLDHLIGAFLGQLCRRETDALVEP